MAAALRTLARYGGGTLVVSGHQGEAERLAHLAADHNVIVEPSARTTRENVERSIPFMEDADRIAVASDWFHARRAGRHLEQLRPDLGVRLVPAHRRWVRGLWMETTGGAYAAFLFARRLTRRA